MPSRNSSRRPLARNSSHRPLTLERAIALGAIHGAAELLPVSSSGHMTAVSWLLDWEWDELEAELRKSFEVAVHAGTALALLTRPGGRFELRVPGRREVALIALATAPPVAAGYLFERQIEHRLSRPSVVAAGLASGALAMALADGFPQERRHGDAALADGLWLGGAQALALIPGVSRRGATLAAARFRSFSAADADVLSWQVGLPVLAGATLLKSVRLLQRAPGRDAGLALSVGAGCSFASTLLLGRAVRGRSLLPYAGYRLALATLMVSRLRRGSTSGRPQPARL